MCFSSGYFTGPAERWSASEKEWFSIEEQIFKMDYLTVRRTTSIYTGDANLVYIYDPYGQNLGVARYTAKKASVVGAQVETIPLHHWACPRREGRLDRYDLQKGCVGEEDSMTYKCNTSQCRRRNRLFFTEENHGVTKHAC